MGAPISQPANYPERFFCPCVWRFSVLIYDVEFLFYFHKNKKATHQNSKLINFQIWNREQLNKTHSKIWFIVWIPYIKSQNDIFQDLVNVQVFCAQNFRFACFEFHENWSVHYRKDSLNNGTCCIIKCVLCLKYFNLLLFFFFFFKVPWFFSRFSFFYSFFGSVDSCL